MADCCVRSPFPGSSRGSPGPWGSLRGQLAHLGRAPCPFTPVQFSIEVVYSRSAIKPELFSLKAPSPFPNLWEQWEGTGEDHWGGRGIPRGSVTWPSCRFFTSCASQRFVVVSSFSTWAKVVSFSWSGRHCLSASRALHQKQTNQPGRPKNKSTFGRQERAPVLDINIQNPGNLWLCQVTWRSHENSLKLIWSIGSGSPGSAVCTHF